MKSFRKIFIGGLVLLFGPWVNMQAQDSEAVLEGNTITKIVKNKTSRSLKQKRMTEYISEHPGVIQLAGGGTITFEVSGECARKSFTAKASEIMLSFPLSEPFPLENLEDYIHKEEAIYNGLEREFEDLRHDRPGEGEDKYNMRQEALKKLKNEMIFHRDMLLAARSSQSLIENYLDTFIAYVTNGLTPIGG
ncbi:MAG: hypothetical protein J6W86_02495 [Bacteroidales bacterium]|nr:hypothetical protein [Bacteroidales bacterium]